MNSLNEQRTLVVWKLDGVDAAAAARSQVASGTSLLGIVKHLAWVERWWFDDYIGGGTIGFPWSDDDPDADFRIESGETVQSISQLYADSVIASNAVIERAADLDVTGTKLEHTRSLRWVIVHMIEETARRLGHMDILRELLDGQTGYHQTTAERSGQRNSTTYEAAYRTTSTSPVRRS